MIINKDNSFYPEEKLIVVDQQDNIIGYENKMKCHEGEGILHRAFSILIFNDEKKLLLQKRSRKKLLWPLYWSNSVCSHPRPGESYKEAAMRRLKEELGFATALTLLYKFQYQARFENIGAENEICCVYIGKANGTVRANPEEIAEWKYIDPNILNNHLINHPQLYTPWFKIEWDRVQAHHRMDIDNL